MSTTSSVTIVQGVRGSGKTNYLKVRLHPIRPLYVIDIRNEYQHIQALRSFSEFVDYLTGLRDKPEESMTHQIRFAFTNTRDYIRLFEVLESFKNCTLIVDEADALFTVRDFEKPLTNVFLGSRNNNINMIFVAKRPFLIPLLIRSQADEFVIFFTREPRDIDWFETHLRQQMPKEPFKLVQGEAIFLREGKPPMLEKFKKFDPNKGQKRSTFPELETAPGNTNQEEAIPNE